jgi:hypothetical protein
MRLYVVVTGCYDDTGIGGVYSSPERAMAAHPVSPGHLYPKNPSAADASRRGGWRQDYSGQWHNGLDWHNSAYINELWLDDVEVP